MAERWAQMLTYWRPFEGASEQLRQSFRLDGDTLVAEEPTAVGDLDYTPWRVIAHPLGWLEVMNGYGDHLYTPGVKLRDSGGTLLWEWSHPDLEPFTMDAAVDADGYVYAVTSIDHPVDAGATGFDVYRIDPATGDGTHLATVWHSDLPEPITTNGDVIEGTSIALSADASVAYVLVSPSTSWLAPGEQVLVGIDLASGALLWMLRLEREQPGYYYGPYNFYDSFNVRSVPGEDTCYVTYEVLHTVNEWRWIRLARIEFPDGPGQKPTQAWTREPFSAEETDTYGLWQGMRDLVVTEDAVLIAVEQGYDTPAPARLILKYDHAGELLWTWGDDQVGENAAITANGLAVAAGVVFFSLEFGDQTERYPRQAGLGALDYDTGEFLELGLFPLDSYWNGPVAAVGEVVPPEPVEPDFIVNPATPPDTTSYDCAAPQVTAVDECVPVPVALTGAWCANPPPEYSDPAVPWPMAPREVAFVMIDREWLDENPPRALWLDYDGRIMYELQPETAPWSAKYHHGVVDTARHWDGTYASERWRDGERLWRIGPEDDWGVQTRLVRRDGTTYDINPRFDYNVEVFHTDADGNRSLVSTFLHEHGGRPHAFSAAVLSWDERVIHLLSQPTSAPRTLALMSYRVADGAKVGYMELTVPQGDATLPTLAEGGLMRLPNSEDLVVAIDANLGAPHWHRPVVTRYHLASADAAPEMVWQTELYNSGPIVNAGHALALWGNVVLLHHAQLGTGPYDAKEDPYSFTALDVETGDELWHMGETWQGVSQGSAVAVHRDRALVATWREPEGWVYMLIDLVERRELASGILPYVGITNGIVAHNVPPEDPPPPEPDPSGDAVLYLTYRTEDGAEVAAFDDDGNRLWTEASPGDPERVVAQPEQALVVSYDGGDVWRVLRSHPAAEGWSWDWNVDTRIHDAVVTRAGEVYVATREGDEVQVRRVRPGDGEVVVALTPLDDLGEPNGSPVSLALTSDDAFLYVLMVSDDGTASYLLCFDLVGRELWWVRSLTNASVEQSEQARVRRVPGGGDDIVLTYLDGNGPDLHVTRFEVAAPGEWPEVMWSKSLSSSFGYLAGVAVNASGVYVAHYDYDDPARVVALDVGNGDQMWASDLSETTTSPWGVDPLNNGLAATDDHVYVALYGADVPFPDWKQGFVRLDAATGALAPAGEFPLEVYQVRQADAVVSDEDDDPFEPM